MSRLPKIKLLALLVVIALVWFGLANPLNLFVRRSVKFSEEEFLSIRPGTPIADAIERLGSPVKVVPTKYDLGCSDCVAYYFLGDPPSWLLSFEEAWLLVDARGRVVAVTLQGEP